MIPSPTVVGPFWRRRILECNCMLFSFNNPHGWARAYCTPTPMAPDGQPDYRKEQRPGSLIHPGQRKHQS